MKRLTLREAPPALDLLEDAVHLLRATPLSDFLGWFAGAGPFALGLLYFWADMSRSSTAAARLPSAALGLACLFLWARMGQAWFAARLRARLADQRPERLTLRWSWTTLLPLVAWQPVALLLLPASLMLIAPFPWYLAFQQSLVITASRADGGALRNLKLAAQHSVYRSQENSKVVSLLSLVWLAVLVNVSVVLFSLPQLAKLLLGVESHFTLSPDAVFNTTFAAAALVLTTLIADPLTRAVYVLRDFQATSQNTGEDLLATLRRLRPAGVLVLLIFASIHPLPTQAQPSAPATTPAQSGHAVTPAELNRAITEVLRRPEFTWREPRLPLAEVEKESNLSRLERLLAPVRRFVEGFFKRIEPAFKGFFDWLEQKLGRRTPPPATPPVRFDLSGFVEFLMWLLIVVGAGALGWFGVRIWRRRQPVEEVPVVPVTTLPDLNADEVSADQLPDDGWLALARELAERGELRPALRAFYLASLAHLARRELIRLVRSKSNREYATEVRRRARDRPLVSDTFAGLVAVFEKVWYGGRSVTPEGLADFAAEVERLRTP